MAGALRAQLGDISAASQLLLRSAGERERQYLAVIDRAAFRCSRLVHEGELARRLAGSEPPEVRLDTMDLAAWCRETCEISAELLAGGGVSLRCACEERAIITLGDRELLDALLYALISNAAKAAGHGGRVSVSLARRGKNAVLAVGDRGGGFSGEALERLVDGGGLDPNLTPGAGAGLGLRLSQAIARAHGGLLVLPVGTGAAGCCVASIPIREGEPARLECALKTSGRDQALEALSEVLPVECFMS